VKIKNPVSGDMNVLRPSLIIGCADVLRRNVARGIVDVRIFECGTVFSLKNGIPQEEEQIAGILTGRTRPQNYYKDEIIDFFYVKGIVETILKDCGIENLTSERINFPFLENVFLFKDSKKPLFLIGELPKDSLNFFDVKKEYLNSPVFYFEFYFKNVEVPDKKYSPPPSVPPVIRDISIVVDEKIKFGEILKWIRNMNVKHLCDIVLVDIYKGSQTGKGRRSLSFRFFFQAEETLLQTDVERCLSEILGSLKNKFGATLREK
jgi:phenylalanyl-tRNA synthetase beta chain